MGKNKKYVALFSCLVLVVALGAGIAGSRSAKKEADEQRKANEAAVSQAEDYSQMVTANRNAGSGNKIDEQNNTKSNTGTDIQEEMKGTGQISNDPAEPENDGSQNQEETSGSTAENNDAVSDETAQLDMESEEFVLADSAGAKPVFNWPLEGDIVMDFSSDALVYDSTLDQYRTNDTICISAAKGTPVKASSDGTVESVSESDEEGNTVTIFHGNGWRTTYGQLDDSIAVSQGDIVKAGDVIGTVGTPSKYSVALGEHLSFEVSENETAIDPKVALAE